MTRAKPLFQLAQGLRAIVLSTRPEVFRPFYADLLIESAQFHGKVVLQATDLGGGVAKLPGHDCLAADHPDRDPARGTECPEELWRSTSRDRGWRSVPRGR